MMQPVPYTLVDAEQRFGIGQIPSRADRESLKLNSTAKLIFESSDGLRGERMWVMITQVRKYETGRVQYFGILDNDPIVFSDCLSPGSEIAFSPAHVIEING